MQTTPKEMARRAREMFAEPVLRSAADIVNEMSRMAGDLDAPEAATLSASPIACAVADAWAAVLAERATVKGSPRAATMKRDDLHDVSAALDALEAATRESPLRKVRP